MKTYKGKYKIKNPDKYLGDPSNVIYRSGWELAVMNWADTSPQIRKWGSEETVIPIYVKLIGNHIDTSWTFLYSMTMVGLYWLK